MDELLDSKQMIEFFQNTFTEEQPNCKHLEIDGYGYCVNCGEGISNCIHETAYVMIGYPNQKVVLVRYLMPIMLNSHP